MRPMVELGSAQQVRQGQRPVHRLGRQRRRGRVHSQGRRPVRLRRDRRAGCDLADLVGAAQARPRAHLSRRRRRAGRGFALHRLFRPQERAVHVSCPRPRNRPRPEQLCPHPLPEVLQDHRRQGLGRLLPLHLHDLSQGHDAPHVHSRPLVRGEAGTRQCRSASVRRSK